MSGKLLQPYFAVGGQVGAILLGDVFQSGIGGFIHARKAQGLGTSECCA